MKKILVSAFMACAIMMAPTAFAQQTAKKECGKCPQENRYEKMSKELNLTEAQMTEIKAADAKFATSSKESREAMKAANEERDAAYKKILTTEQYAKMKEMQPSRSSHKGKPEMHKGKKSCCPDSAAVRKGCCKQQAQ